MRRDVPRVLTRTTTLIMKSLPKQHLFACFLAICATLSPSRADEVALDSLDLTRISNGWGQAQAGKEVAGAPITMRGKVFARGVGVHAPSSVSVDLQKRASRFRATVGIQDGQAGTVEFLVYGDGKVLHQTGAVRGGDKPREVDVDVTGIKRMKLEVSACGTMDYDHANWADATIMYTGAPPRFIDTSVNSPALYPPEDKLTASPGDTSYFVDPASGSDTAAGTTKDKAWKSIARVNAIKLAPGDKVEIAPGEHDASLKPVAAGTAEKPVVIDLLPGTHAFGSEDAFRRPYHVSNSADNPAHPLPIGIMIENARHLHIRGGGADGKGKTKVVLAGPERMTYFINDHAADIAFSGLTFDLKRPTVSEFRVIEKSDNSVVVQVEAASTFAIREGKFAWTGDVGTRGLMVQQAIPADGRCWRMGGWDPFTSATAEDLGGGKVRLAYAKGTCGMEKDRQFQFRATFRDVVTAHNTRCKNISFRDCDIHAMTGMGIVSQFTDGLTFERVRVAPEAGTLRTCPAWADMFHFSGCRGRILVSDCVFSGSQDDPINVHGTHLRITGKPADNQLLLRFMHPQTYGFAAFQPGDEVAVVSHANLRELPGNPRRKVAAIAPNPADPTGHEWLLTLDGPAPAFAANDVVDNLTWYPDVTIRNCKVDMDSCRGFLLTTRGKVLVEGCTFHRCTMAGILIEDDAEGWFESGPINDMTLSGNRFIGCNVEINPQSKSTNPEEPVHENIRITGNYFDGAGISAHHTRGLTITGNRSRGGKIPLNLAPTCTRVEARDNDLKGE